MIHSTGISPGSTPSSYTLCIINKKSDIPSSMTQQEHDIAFSFDFDQITHIVEEFTGNFHPHPPPSFMTSENRVCYEIPPVMSGLPTTFPCEEGLCKAAWDTKATAQRE